MAQSFVPLGELQEDAEAEESQPTQEKVDRVVIVVEHVSELPILIVAHPTVN